MKVCKYSLSTLVCLLTIVFLSPNGWAAKRHQKRPYAVTAKSAILSDVTGGDRLYGKNVEKRVFPASTTKVMTALLVFENLPLDKVVTVSPYATTVAPSKAGLIAGEQYTVSELLCAALMQSANDASVVLAEAVAGSENQFVEMMNRRAKALGAHNTKFANPNGLPTEKTQYTTAYDMMLIFKEALKFPVFKEILRQKNKTIVSQGGRKIAIKSYNKLLWKGWRETIFGKTGYTKKAQHCFVGYIEDGKKTMIIGVFGCSRRWQDIQYVVTKYGRVRL